MDGGLDGCINGWVEEEVGRLGGGSVSLKLLRVLVE